MKKKKKKKRIAYDPKRMFSLRFLAGALKIDRSIISRRMKSAGTLHVKGKNNASMYRMTDVVRECLDLIKSAPRRRTKSPEEEIEGKDFKGNLPTDFSTWSPLQQKTYFEARLKELEFKRETGELMEARVATHDFADLFKRFGTNYQLLVDVLAHETDMSPAQVTKIQEVVDRKQGELQQQVIEYGKQIAVRESRGDGI